MSSNKVVIGLVETYAQAEQIVAELQGAGFASSEISVLLPDKQGTRDFAHEKHTKAPEGSAVGASAGGLLGGTLGLLAGIGSLAIPGLGPLIAAGPILATLSGGAAGAALGALTGALVGLGIPEIEAKQYESKIKGGNILISVHVDDSDERTKAKQVFEQCAAKDIAVTGEKRVPAKDQASPAAR
jgi:hypothetical protein